MPSDVLTPLLKKLREGGGRVRAGGLKGSSRAYVLSRVVESLDKPLVVLTPGMPEARDFAEELGFFLGTGGDPAQLPWDRRVVLFPPWDSLPYENIPPHPDTSARRTAALFRALNGGPFVFVAPVEATFRLLPPPEAIDRAAMTLSVGEAPDRETLLDALLSSGYTRVGQVEERGEMALRGGILDIFAPHYPEPVRVEFFGDEIESLRLFDPATQRSTLTLKEAVILPAREVTGGADSAANAVEALRKRCHALGFNLSQTAEALEPFRRSPYAPERECQLSYYYEKTATFWDYFGKDVPVVLDMVENPLDRMEAQAEENARGYARATEAGRLLPPPEGINISPRTWKEGLDPHPVLLLDETAGDERLVENFDYETASNSDLAALLKRSRGAERLFGPLVDRIAKDRADGINVALVCRGKGQAGKLGDILYEYGLFLGEPETYSAPGPDEISRLKVYLGNLDRGFRFPADRLTIITDTEIFGIKGRRPPVRRSGFSSNLSDLNENDYVVHVDFGIGRFKGMVRLAVEGVDGDYLHLEYADGGRLYLPVTRLNLIQRYTAPGDFEVRLDKIGGKTWEKSRKKAAEGIEKMAHELLELYARRELASRPAYPGEDLAYREFESTFPYEETRDQASAITDVMADLARERPMDRLICGDVGYGKTEVAIRAAFRAVEAGRQVAVLAPTTVLAAQHFQNFSKRFEGYPINVEMLSRFVDKTSQKGASAGLASGGVDIVVGTHKLLSSELKFKNLGLLVIDEEHRFGVAQKEKLKKFRNNVDILTLSATPIPRTLQMGLTGARDLSIIETPPADRLAVRTRVARHDDEFIREAVTRELARGGQVYFVHNRVQSIDAIAEKLAALIPGLKMGVGHGQMKEEDLKKVMASFSSGETDVLVCTAIIESGLDIPRANTIIIDRADTFGLADLYQLRGRVGRANLQAYCYLIVPEERDMTGDARKRIAALQQFTELGAGFKVAIHDLEIRGAGEFLGKNQSGQIAAIGFEMYADLLDDAVRRLKGEPYGRAPEPEIRLKVPAHFPEDYVKDPRTRLELYERLTGMDREELDEIAYELIDRFGPVPEPVKNLVETMKVRLLLMGARATGLDLAGDRLVLSLDENHAIAHEKIVGLASAHPAKCRITPDGKVRWQTGLVEGAAVFEAAAGFLSLLGVV